MSKTKTSKRKNSHRVPVYRRPWILLLFFLVMAAVVVFALIFIKPRSEEQPITTPSSEQSTAKPAPVTPAQEEATTTETPQDEPEDKTTQYEGEDPNTLAQLTGSLTRKGVNDGILTIVAVIDQYLQTTGYCTIVLTNDAGQTIYSASRDAVADVTASVCDTFEIPVASLPHGTYHIEIDLSSGAKQGVITDEVEL